MNDKTYTLLIVEDVPEVREVYRYYLLADPNCVYSLLEAQSVAEGLELCNTRSIDAIVLDYALPDGNGLEFLAALSSQSNGSMPPVVMITGRGNESIAVQAIKLGAEDYLVKPKFTQELLQKTVRSAIDNARLRLQLQHSNEQLQAKHQQMTAIWESMTDAYMILDRDWRIVYTNPMATELVRQLVDLAPAEFLCKTHWEVFPWSVGNVVEQEYRRAVIERVAVHFEVLYEPTGAWFEVHAYPSETGLGIYFRGIDERKRLETERQGVAAVMLENEQKFRAIFNQTFELMGIVSLDGVLLQVNQTALASISAVESEIIGRSFWEAPWWHTEQLRQQLQEAIATAASGQFVRYEVEFANGSGDPTITDFSLKPVLDEAGRVTMLIAEARDITERKQIQAVLEARTQELDRAATVLQQRNQELDSFVYIVAHDLKAPLRAISNLSQWIEEDLSGKILADTQSQMTLLRSRVERMSATIDGLLDYARIGQTAALMPQGRSANESVVVAELLVEVIDSIDPPPTFTISIAPNLPTLDTKWLLLFQIFSNLVSNAVKHHDKADGLIQISGRECGDFYEFAVADDGAGIAPEHHEQIFEIFKSVNPQNRSDSTGIGLAIVKKIIEAEGGSIWLESEIGQGTTFYFTLPMRGSAHLK